MDYVDFVRVLERFASRFNAEIISGGDCSFELRFAGISPGVRKLLDCEFGHTGDVWALHCYCFAGVVTRPEAVLDLLQMNNAGLAGSRFYCSICEFQGRHLLQFETRQIVCTDISEDQLLDLFTRIFTSPILLMPPEMPPQGVHFFFEK